MSRNLAPHFQNSWETRKEVPEGVIVDEEGSLPIHIDVPLQDSLQQIIRSWARQEHTHALLPSPGVVCREELLARQQGMCKLCGAPIGLGTFEIDHVIPVAQSFSGQQQELQALCIECHRTKTSLEGNHSTTLESRFCRYVYQNYAASPRLPPLVFQLRMWDLDRPCQGIDVCRCRKNGLANARFPLPVFCPLDCIAPTEEGQLADLMWVELPCDHRKGVLDRLPYVGRGWYAKPVCAYMLEAGLAQWQHFKWSLDATAHVDQQCLEQVLQRLEHKARSTTPS